MPFLRWLKPTAMMKKLIAVPFMGRVRKQGFNGFSLTISGLVTVSLKNMSAINIFIFV
jgi:hypothetical protein